jgi:hypothetical protein
MVESLLYLWYNLHFETYRRKHIFLPVNLPQNLPSYIKNKNRAEHLCPILPSKTFCELVLEPGSQSSIRI